MKTGTIRQKIVIAADPKRVYDALMTSKGHKAFTGAAARISGKVGGKFMAWGGYIHGKNLVLVRGKKIVQAWRPSEETWPKDHFSKVSYVLAKVKNGTRITFTHSGVPHDHVGHLSSGWKQSYWDPLSKYFRSGRK